jgi:hypothetical protein
MRTPAALLLSLLWTAGALAGSPRSAARALLPRDLPTRPGEVRVAAHLTLDAISAPELTQGRGSAALDMGVWRGPGSAFDISPIVLQVTRLVPRIWQMRVADTTSPAAIDVRYEVFGADGSPGRLTHVEHPGDALRVVIEPTRPEVIASDDQGTVVEGGAALQLWLDQARYAGTYTGTVVVTINSF